jgi:putative nucleotidyltransferase with HDIG domain
MSMVQNIIETQEFATLPAVASKILNLLEDENVSIRELSQVIEADASLTLKLLRVANSPLYATRTEINTIHQAIVTLGLSRLTNIVLGVSIFSKFLFTSQKDVLKLMEEFWWHTSCTGMVAKSLCNRAGLFFKENEFIGGLLHDIGKLAMMQYDNDMYRKVIDLTTKEHITDIDAEMQVFGVSHTEVGNHIAELWQLPNDLCDVITHHTYPKNAESNKELTAVVRLADILTEMWGAGFYEGILKFDIAGSTSWKILQESNEEMKDMDIEILTFNLEKDFLNTSEFLNLIVQS